MKSNRKIFIAVQFCIKSTVRNVLVVIALAFLLPGYGLAQDTFSIVAVDTLTGEIGSAGASCVTASGAYPHGAAILSDVIPGIGAIHTQASWHPTNQSNAHAHMIAGESPQQIVDWLVAHDAQGNPTTRQYGIVDFRNNLPRAASYTGVNCMNYKNDTAGVFYSIQGNILLGQKILDSMQSWFGATQGTLADRLMAALQGAKVVGADTRCAANNSSSLSAFLRVAKPTDDPDSLYLDLWMAYPQGFTGLVPKDPIDSLQILYNQWKISLDVDENTILPVNLVKVLRADDGSLVLDFSGYPASANLKLVVFDLTGQLVLESNVNERFVRPFGNHTSARGMYIYAVLNAGSRIVARGKLVND